MFPLTFFQYVLTLITLIERCISQSHFAIHELMKAEQLERKDEEARKKNCNRNDLNLLNIKEGVNFNFLD